MDLSKLPRLSKTDAPPPNQGAAEDDGPAYATRVPVGYASAPVYEEPPSWGIEAWFSIGLGVLLLLLQPTMLQFVSSKIFGTHFGPYTDGQGGWVDHVSMVDANGNVAATIPYTKTTPAVSPNFWNDLVITGFALALITEGAVLWLSRRAYPVLLTFALTAAAALANLLYLFISFKYGLALLSALAVLIGGYMAFSQWRLFRWRASTGYQPRPPPPIAAAAVAAPRVDPAAQLVGRTLGGEHKARCTHYRFAHTALRQAALENPARCVGILQTPGEASKNFLTDLWSAVRAGCGASADSNDDAPDGLEPETTQVGPYSAVIVRMPRPRYKGEAYFVGLVLRSYTRADGSTIERSPLLLYYTLEVAGEYADGELKPAFCEWQAGDHVRFAEKPEPTVPDFRAAMQEKVTALQKREDELAFRGTLA